MDIAVLTERRQGGEQILKYLAEGISRQISEWLQAAFLQFLSSESPALMGIEGLGNFKFHAIEKFRETLHAVTIASLKTEPIPTWAADRVIEAWNIPAF